MKFPLFSPKKNDQRSEEKLVTIPPPPQNTDEGSEFIDDAIRMNEQPIVRTEVSIAPGNPQDLL